MKISNKVLGGTLFVFSAMIAVCAYAATPSTVDLRSSGDFTVLAKTGISTTGATSISGDIGVSPAEATYITGFGLILPDASSYATSSLIAGKVYAPGYKDPTPSKITTAISDMEIAYTDASGRTPSVTELSAGNIGGLTLAPGVYKWGTDVIIPTDVTLSGSSSDVWIFQIAGNLDISSATKIILSGGAQARNIFWVVAGQTTLGTTSVFNGNILDQTAIVLNTGARLNGRALAQSAVTLDSNIVSVPSYSSTSSSSISSSTITVTTTPSEVMCTMEAKQCSDGSYVGRSGPKCEFALCPSVGSSITYTSGSTSVTYNFGTTTLKNGSKGNAVMELQKFLNKVLKSNIKVDGKLGKMTISLVKKWQNDNGLVADGLVGAKTKLKMNAMVQ